MLTNKKTKDGDTCRVEIGVVEDSVGVCYRNEEEEE